MIPISKPLIGEAEKQAVLAVLESGQLAQGPRVAELEARFARLAGVEHAVAVASGTAALHLALLAHGLGPGDEVITTPFSFAATANCVLLCGARPVFVDVEAETCNLNPALVESALTPRTRALLPVHLYGQMCDMAPLQALAARHGLALIEDACQAVGADDHGRPAGSFGTGVFSLYATKNITAGEGGMITTDDPQVAERCRRLRNHGRAEDGGHVALGYNYRLSDLHAALGLAQFERLAEHTARRRANAAFLGAHLRRVVTPAARPGYGHVWHQYTVCVAKGRDAAIRQLNARGIGTGLFYPVPLHHLPHVRAASGPAHLPVAERLAREVLSLPVHPGLSAADLELIAAEANRL